MRHTFGIYQRLLSVQLRSQMQYRVSFWLDMAGTAVITLFEFAALALVFDRFGDLGGWSLGQVAFLYGIVELAFGFMDMVFAGFDPPFFGREVRMGAFDRVMLRPINVTTQVLGSRLEIRRIGKILFSMGILAFAFSLTNIQWTALKFLYLPIIILSNVLFFGGLFMIGATITFWTIESIEVMNTLTYGGSFTTSHPMHIYPNWIIRFFTFIVPAIFLTYFPAIYILDLPNPLGYPEISYFLSPLIGIVALLAGLLVPTNGEVVVNGRVPWKERQAHVNRIGAVFGHSAPPYGGICPSSNRWNCCNTSIKSPRIVFAKISMSLSRCWNYGRFSTHPCTPFH